MLLWFALQAAPDLDATLAQYRDRTRAIVECRGGRPDDIVICDRRAADQFRLPLVELDLSDPKNESVRAERDRLLARTNNCEEKAPFLVGCGKAGIGVSTRGGVRGLGERPLAP